MVLGFLVGSIVYVAFRKTLPPKVTVVSFPLATRLPVLTKASGIGWPSISPETIDNSPSSLARSFLTASDSFASGAGGSFLGWSWLAASRLSDSSARPLPAGAANSLGLSLAVSVRQIFQVS